VVLTGSLREIAGSDAEIEIDASNVRDLLRELETHVPGISQKVEDGLSIALDGDIIQDPMLEPIGPNTEVHFLPPIRGG
jgi:molybdopterin converting factor small subunit